MVPWSKNIYFLKSDFLIFSSNVFYKPSYFLKKNKSTPPPEENKIPYLKNGGRACPDPELAYVPQADNIQSFVIHIHIQIYNFNIMYEENRRNKMSWKVKTVL